MSDKTKNTYGVMLIGCGNIGDTHMADIYYRENIQVIAVVDLDIERARLFRRKFGAECYGTDYRPFLAREDLDIVLIATNVDAHMEIIADCIAANKHILCEKPIATNAADGEAFYQMTSQAKVAVTVGMLLRFHESFLKVKELLDSGVIGELKVIRLVHNQHCKDWPRFHRLLQDCPPIMECGVHYFDLVQWLTDSPIVQVSGFGALTVDDLPEGDYNYALAGMKTENGVVAHYEVGWAETFSSCDIKEFVGTEGRISLTLSQFRSTNTEEGDLIEVYTKDGDEYRTVNVKANNKPMWEQFRGLIDKIEGRPSASATLEECYSAFCATLAADRAIRNQEIITI